MKTTKFAAAIVVALLTATFADERRNAAEPIGQPEQYLTTPDVPVIQEVESRVWYCLDTVTHLLAGFLDDQLEHVDVRG